MVSDSAMIAERDRTPVPVLWASERECKLCRFETLTAITYSRLDFIRICDTKFSHRMQSVIIECSNRWCDVVYLARCSDHVWALAVHSGKMAASIWRMWAVAWQCVAAIATQTDTGCAECMFDWKPEIEILFMDQYSVSEIHVNLMEFRISYIIFRLDRCALNACLSACRSLGYVASICYLWQTNHHKFWLRISSYVAVWWHFTFIDETTTKNIK